MAAAFGLAIIVVLGWGTYTFNAVVRLRNQVRAAWADIDVQLNRRHDLVPRLVAAVQAYAGHERATLQAVTELRARALATSNPSELGNVESALEAELARLIAWREAYPDLKSNENFLRLQRDLVDVEDHLQYARRFYNGAVRDYNTAIQKVPAVLVARSFAFHAREYFQVGDDERSAISPERMT